VYIANPGTYSAEIKGATNFALDSNVVTGLNDPVYITPKLDGGAIYIQGALDDAGGLYLCGLGNDGQLGQGNTNNSTNYVKVKGVGGSGFLENIVDFKIGPGQPFVIACDSSGKCYAWGDNGDGQLGQGNLNDSYTPLQVKGVGGTGFLENIISVSCGHYHSLACDSSGNCYAWGDNFYNSSATQGQLGDGTIVNKTTPIRVLGVGGSGYLTNIIQVAAKPHSSQALSSSGHVYCWGTNQFGECGDGTETNRLTPVQVIGVGGTGYLSGITKLARGDGYYADCGLALGSNGRVYAWGYNSWGQLGVGNENNSSTPQIVKGVGGTGYLENIIDVACGGYHCFALDSSGTVYAWGNNSSEAPIGDGTSTRRTTPVKVKGVGNSGYLGNIVVIGGERFGGSAMDADGNVYAWSGNQNYQVGDGTNTVRTSPVQVLGVGGTGFLNLKTKVPPPSLTYDGLNSLKVTGAEASSTITYKAYESNKFLACGTDLTTYPLFKTGNYKAEIAGSNTFTLTSNVLVPATNIVPLYQYPPTDGTTSGVTETVTADVNSIWTISGAGYGNGLYYAQASVAATSTSVTAYHAFDDNLVAGFETTTTTGTLMVQLPSATTIHKYVVWPKAADGNRPKSWTIEGSQDTATWTTIHTVTDTPPSLSGDIHEISSPAAYIYYRINVSANNGGTALEIAELVLWGDVAFSITFSDGWVTTTGTTSVTLGSVYTLPTYTSSLPVTVTGASDFDVDTAGTYIVVYTSIDMNELVKRVIRRFVVA